MDSMTGIVTPNSMIIHANVTIQKSMAARIENNVAAVQIVRRGQQARRVRLAREVQLVPRVFLESEAR